MSKETCVGDKRQKRYVSQQDICLYEGMTRKTVISQKRSLLSQKKSLLSQKKSLFSQKRSLFSQKRSLFSQKRSRLSQERSLLSQKRYRLSQKRYVFRQEIRLKRHEVSLSTFVKSSLLTFLRDVCCSFDISLLMILETYVGDKRYLFVTFVRVSLTKV